MALSDDHKPDNAEEKERVLAAGGYVRECAGDVPRVNGELAVSRAVGDFVYKRCETQAGDACAL